MTRLRAVALWLGPLSLQLLFALAVLVPNLNWS